MKNSNPLVVIRIVLQAACIALLSACSIAPKPSGLQAEEISQSASIKAILERHQPQAAAIGIITNGHLHQEVYYGSEREKVPVTAASRFEVASVSKLIASETFLRMVAAGDASPDMKLGDYWIDPDLVDDPLVKALTARHVLTHRTGFPNWRFFRADGKLVFEAEPGKRYGYSGEGFQYLFRALEEKTALAYPQMVQHYLLQPLDIDDAVVGFEEGVRPSMVWNRTKKGEWLRPDCRPGFCWPAGDWSAAGGLKISLRDLSRILIAIGDAEGYDASLAQMRDRIVTDRGKEATIDCELAPSQCPQSQGYGLGMLRLDRDGKKWIGHEGGDWAQLTIAIIDTVGRDGFIILLAGPMDENVPLMRALVGLIDPANPWVTRFEQWEARISAHQ